jgi:nitrosocyanin
MLWILLAVTVVFAEEPFHHMMMDEKKMHMIESKTKKEDLGICPVMKGNASKEYSYIYKGKTYYFCCPRCINKFRKDPEKYISKIKEINLETYRYGFFPNPIIVKKGDIVKIFATSRDVTHGIHIDRYNINIPVKKGETKKIEFLADKVGEFEISCSVYCGSGHNNMKAKLIVEE